jgi:hypothetical protein
VRGCDVRLTLPRLSPTPQAQADANHRGLDRHSLITLKSDPIGCVEMDFWVVAKKAEGQRRKLTNSVHEPATYKAHYIEGGLVHVCLWNQDQPACVTLNPRYNDPLRIGATAGAAPIPRIESAR